MKPLSLVRSRRMAAAAFVVAGSAMNHTLGAAAHPQSPRGSGHVQVAAIDITESFRRDPRFVGAMNDLRACRTILAGRVIAARRELQDGRERLALLDPDAEAHRIVAARIARREAQLRERIERAKRDLREQESKIYDATYDALVDAVARYARVHGA